MSSAEHFPVKGADHLKAICRVRGSVESGSDEVSVAFEATDAVTEIWRTDPILAGSQNDTFGVAAGPPHSDIVIGGNEIRLRPPIPRFKSQQLKGTRKILTEIHALGTQSGGYRVLAGESYRAHLSSDPRLTATRIARVYRRSYGEIVSRDPSGDISKDFPADGYFNVFLGLVVPAEVTGAEMTLYNREPLLIVDQEINGLPLQHRVFSTHKPVDLYSMPLRGIQSLGHQELAAAGSIQIELGLQDTGFVS